MQKKLILIFALIAFSLSVNYAFTKETANLQGEMFKEVNATAWLNSEPLKIADQKGKTVVLEFWATWCPPCRRTIPHLIELYNKYKDKNVVFMTFTDEPEEVAKPFATEMKMPYPIGTGSKTSKEYGVIGIPHAVIIGADQKIAWSGHPAKPDFEENLAKISALSAPETSAGTVEVKAETAAPEASKTTEVKAESTEIKTENAEPAKAPAAEPETENCGSGK